MPGSKGRAQIDIRAAAARNALMFRHCALLMSLLAFGCSSPGQRIDDLAHAAHLSRRIVEGTHFEHVVYANAIAIESNDQRLFVFLDGDGRPWDADGLRP